MSEPSSPEPRASAPELDPRMDAEIKVQGLRVATDEPKLVSAVAVAKGVEAVNYAQGKLTVRYDPQEISEAAICELIRRTGFQIDAAETATIAPPIESPGKPATESSSGSVEEMKK